MLNFGGVKKNKLAAKPKPPKKEENLRRGFLDVFFQQKSQKSFEWAMSPKAFFAGKRKTKHMEPPKSKHQRQISAW